MGDKFSQVNVWLHRVLTLDPHIRVRSDEVHNLFIASTGICSINHSRFGVLVKKAFPSIRQYRQKISGKFFTLYEGVRFVTVPEEEENSLNISEIMKLRFVAELGFFVMKSEKESCKLGFPYEIKINDMPVVAQLIIKENPTLDIQLLLYGTSHDSKALGAEGLPSTLNNLQAVLKYIKSVSICQGYRNECPECTTCISEKLENDNSEPFTVYRAAKCKRVVLSDTSVCKICQNHRHGRMSTMPQCFPRQPTCPTGGHFPVTDELVTKEMEQCYQCKHKFVNPHFKNKVRMCHLLTVQACRTLYHEQFTKEDIQDLFLCLSCARSLTKVTVLVRKRAYKRCFPAEKFGSQKEKKRKVRVDNDEFLSRVCRHIKTRKYESAIRSLINNVPSAKTAVVKIVATLLQQEKIKLRKSETCLSQELNEKTLDSFQWGTVMSDCQEIAPITVTCLESMLPSPAKMASTTNYGPRTKRRKQTLEEAQEQLEARQGMMLAIAIYSCRPMKFKFVQTFIGLELWRYGAPEKIFRSLHYLGISQGLTAARSNVDRLSRQQDEALTVWKEGMERNLSGEEPMEPEEGEQGERDAEARKRLHLYRPVPTHGYALCWDTATLIPNTGQHLSPTESVLGPWAVCFAVDNRVEPPIDWGGEKAASTLPAYSFLPEPVDYWELRKYMISVVKQILMENFSFLGQLQPRVNTKVTHPYTAQLTEKSQVIGLGVMDIGPSSNSGSAGVISKLQQYVPRKAGVPSPLVCCGDGLSVEQMIHPHTEQEVRVEQISNPHTEEELNVEQMTHPHTGQDLSVEQIIDPNTEQELSVEQMIQSETGQELSVEHMIQSDTEHGLSVEQIMDPHTEQEVNAEHMIQSETGQEPSVEQMTQSHTGQAENGSSGEGLLGLIPAPQESRKEILLLQDFMNRFFKRTTSRGTIRSLKYYLERFCPRKDVQSNFQNSWTMMELATCAYVALHAMEIMNISKQDDMPDGYPTTLKEQRAWLDRVCMEVVDFVWLAPTKQDIKKVAESIAHGGEGVPMEGVFPNGLEGPEDTDEPMVNCYSALCSSSRRARLAELSDPDADWYCSKPCKQDGSYVYCKCQQRKKDILIQCYLEGDCKRHEWYHKECVVSAEDPIPDKWYCSDECALGCEGDDPVQNYSRQLMWDGLNVLVRRDAVREGNGTAIVSHWKMDMIQFHNRNHPEHFIIGAHFLAGVAGFYNERVSFNLIWNRLANISGHASDNISMDLLNEALYSDLKERLYYYRWLYTEKEVQRRWQTCGEFGKSLDRVLYTRSSCESPESAPAPERQICNHTGDVRRFLCEFQKDALTHYLPGRAHYNRLQGFRCNTDIKEPCDLGHKISSMCEELDNWRALSTT